MKANTRSRRLLSFSICLILVLTLLPIHMAAAVSPDIVISQVYGGGGNAGATYKNDFIELFNRGTSPVDITGWTVQYASANGSSWTKTLLAGTIQPGQYYLIQESQGSGGTVDLPTPDATGGIFMSATDGKVALVNNSTILTGTCPAGRVDFVGYGTTNCSEGSSTPKLSNTNAAIRNFGGCVDTDSNSADFLVGSPDPRNTAAPTTDCSVPAGIGLANPNAVFAGDSTLLTVMAFPGNPAHNGLSVACDLSTIGGSASQSFFDDGTNGDVIANDNIFSYNATVPTDTAEAVYSLACMLGYDTGSVAVAIRLIVIPLPIGTVNGPISDTDDGTTHLSPFVGQTVTIQGVIYEKTLQATTSSSTYKGFFIQNTAATADADPYTSDGIFVYLGTSTTLPKSGGGSYTPAVGDEIILTGNVSEYYNMTELVSPFQVVSIERSGVDIDAELPPVEANPPVALADANRYWERLQGMRIQVPLNSIVLGGRNVFSPADAEVWVARPDSTIALRENPYERRAFRDAHPLDDNYDPINWDGNGYRVLMGSLGIKATEGNSQALIAPAHTFATVTNTPSGGLNYTFSKYRIEISTQPDLIDGIDPALNDPPGEIVDRSTEYSIVDYNLENLYDYRNNPFSLCDFAGDTGCKATYPFIGDVNPAFNYVPASEADYQARLYDIATQIINDLHNPDILMVQEIENQDICAVSGASLVCGSSDNADGKPDVLQDLALEVASLGGPAYDAAFDRNSSDLRGIAPAFMYRTDRVELVPPDGDPVLGSNPAIAGYESVAYDNDVSNPKSLNAVLPAGIPTCETYWVFPRAPDVALFRIHTTNPEEDFYRDVYVINNHFKSGPDTCVAHRTEQAKYNAALVAYLQAAEPGARVVIGGDLNVYPRPDDIAYGATDQLGSLYNSDLGLRNLWEVILAQAPESAYSYVYLGMAQTLDQMFVNKLMESDLSEFHIAHINSDFAADYSGDIARGTSDHDPNVAVFSLNWFSPPIANPPELNKSTAGSSIPVKFSLNGDQGMDIFAAGYPVSQQIDCSTGAPIGDAVQITTNAFNYDPLEDQYVLVWQTDGSWAGTCRQLVVQLTDGTNHFAYFKFK